jgi:hypothetical protein
MSDQLDTDLSARYDERPRHAPTDHPAFDPAFTPPEAWVNYWDMHCIEHGGTFVTWDDDYGWTVVEVTPPAAHTAREHTVERYRFRPADVWTEPDDPWTDFTDEMKRVLRSFDDEHHLPVAPPFLDAATFYVVGLTNHRTVRRQTFEVDEGDIAGYWSHVAGYGVDPADVQGVAADALPAPARTHD